MPDATACAICKGPLIGRMPAIIAGKPAYVCARCGALGSRPPPLGKAPAPPSATDRSQGPAYAGFCIGPRGVEKFLNDLLKDGARVETICQVGAYKDPSAPPGTGNGGPDDPQSMLPVLLVTIVLESGGSHAGQDQGAERNPDGAEAPV